MRGGGYFIARAIWEHPSFTGEPYSEREAFMWLIGAAAWEDRVVRVNGKPLHLKRGQLAHSLRFLAAKFGWPEPRVRRFLHRRTTDAQIDAEATQGSTRITICNYDEYQHTRRTDESEIDAGMESKSTQRETINNKTTNKIQNLNRSVVGEVLPPELMELPEGPPAAREQPSLEFEPIATPRKSTALTPTDDWPRDYGELFWSAYPPGRKSGKKAVLAKLATIRKKNEVTFARLMDGLSRYVASAPEPQYTKGPLVWLNQGCWDDEPPPRPGGPGGRKLSYADIARGNF